MGEKWADLFYELLYWSAAKTKEFQVSGLDEKLLKGLREDSVDESIVNEELRASNDDDLQTSTSFRKKLAHLLHSTPTEIFLVVLVIVDVVALLAMLVLDLNILQMEQRDLRHANEVGLKALQSHCDGNQALNEYGGDNLITVTNLLVEYGCIWSDPESNKTNGDEILNSQTRHKRAAKQSGDGPVNETIAILSHIAHALHILSIVILAIMVLEVLLKIFAMGAQYFKGKLEVIDGVVIIISFTMDLYFTDGVFSDGVSNAATILVIFLLWRIIRVFNAILVTAKKRLQFRIRVQKRMRKNLDDKIDDLDGEVKTLQNHINNLEKVANLHQIPEYEVKACKPLVKHHKKKNTSAGLASMMQMSMGLLQGMNNINTENRSPEVKEEGLSSMLKRRPSLVQEDDEKDDDCAHDVAGVLKSAIHVNEALQKDDEENTTDTRQPGKLERSNTESALLPVMNFMAAVATGQEQQICKPEQIQCDDKSNCVDRPSMPGLNFVTAVATGISDSFSQLPEKQTEILDDDVEAGSHIPSVEFAKAVAISSCQPVVDSPPDLSLINENDIDAHAG